MLKSSWLSLAVDVIRPGGTCGPTRNQKRMSSTTESTIQMVTMRRKSFSSLLFGLSGVMTNSPLPVRRPCSSASTSRPRFQISNPTHTVRSTASCNYRPRRFKAERLDVVGRIEVTRRHGARVATHAHQRNTDIERRNRERVTNAAAGVRVITREVRAVERCAVTNGAHHIAPLLVAKRTTTVVLVHRHIDQGVRRQFPGRVVHPLAGLRVLDQVRHPRGVNAKSDRSDRLYR